MAAEKVVHNESDFVQKMDIDTHMFDGSYDFPRMLTKEELTCALKKRQILCNDEHCTRLGKDGLLELCRKFIVPAQKKVQLKRGAEKRRTENMMEYIKQVSMNRKSDSITDCGNCYIVKNSAKNYSNINEKVEGRLETCEKLKDVVRISAKDNEKQRKPVKLKRKHSKTESETLIKMPNH